jgi:ComF family protein
VKPDVLVPVPVHQNRLKKRGYNQAALLARELGRLTNIPVAEHLLIRKKDTLPQKELSERERKQNLQDAFALGERQELNLLQECVIIIDDIYTTGATLEECSRVLKQVGIQRIYFLCVCIGKGF